MANIDQAWDLQAGSLRAKKLFSSVVGGEPDGIWASPGRANLIGEHTDYNGGLCLPIALAHRTYVAMRKRDDDRIVLYTDFDGGQRWEGTIGDIEPGKVSGWVAYAAGPVWTLIQAGHSISGFEAALVSCVPLGAGLSSSAAIECAMVLAISDVNKLSLSSDDAGRVELVKACIRAENDIAQAPTGGMDQAASLLCTSGAALLLDCQDGSVAQVPFDLSADGLELLVINTHTPHALVDGQYGQRRAACEQAASTLGVSMLREVKDLDDALEQLSDEVVRRRVRHIYTEIARVNEFVDLLRVGLLRQVGPVMNASHESLRDDYEVSCRELDVVVAAAREAGALGARMTGGGFGGCAIALVDQERSDDIMSHIISACEQAGTPVPSFARVTAQAAGGKINEQST